MSQPALRRTRRYAPFLLGLLAVSTLALRAEKLVTVRAMADTAYAARRAKESPPPIETYVFAKGTYSEGTTDDRSLRKMTFTQVITTLAPELKQQRYEPAKSLDVADLVLVVHWGATMANDRGGVSFELQLAGLPDAMAKVAEAQKADEDDQSLMTHLLGAVEAAQADVRTEMAAATSVSGGNDFTASSNAEILGFGSALNDDRNPDRERGDTLRKMIDEERYYIVVMAYDAKSLRKGNSKKRLWTARLSIRSAGVNFATAVSRMSIAGGAFFGTRQADIVMQPTKDRIGEVKVGDLKVIGEK